MWSDYGMLEDMTTRPRLLLVAHGTRAATGRRVVGRVLLEVRKRLPEVECRLAWVDVQGPPTDRVLADGVPTVVVPAFLTRGMHVVHDIGRACDTAPGRVWATDHLGVEPEVVRALVQRLAESGAVGAFGADAVVLGSAGTRDRVARAESDALAGELQRVLGVPVMAAFASAAAPSVTDAVAGFRATGHRRIAVATHLLAPGFFADRLTGAGADLVSEPLGPHPEIVDLVVRRYLQKAADIGAELAF